MAAAEKPVLSKYRDRMDKAVAALKEEFASLRTGRASANLTTRSPNPRVMEKVRRQTQMIPKPKRTRHRETIVFAPLANRRNTHSQQPRCLG